MSFSQRIGKVPISKAVQLESMDMDLRNSLWNALKLSILDHLGKYYNGQIEPGYMTLCKILWFRYFKYAIDTIPSSAEDAEARLRVKFYKYEWHEVYDFLEFIASIDKSILGDHKRFIDLSNAVLERENSGYRFINNIVCPITNLNEIQEVEGALKLSEQYTLIRVVNVHLTSALSKISAKKNPDYRNSIKESISAVESIVKIIAGNKKDTLPEALNIIKESINLHPALEKGFKNIYGYTSDDNGIRHGLTDEPTCYFEDARFMFISCTAFINYLITKSIKAGIKLGE